MDDGRTILVVEDDQDLVETYRLWLSERDDVTPVVERRGRKALQQISEETGALVLDRRLPDLSGPEIVDRLDDPKFPILVVSAYEPDAALAEDEVDSYVTKPVSKSEFLDAIDRVL